MRLIKILLLGVLTSSVLTGVANAQQQMNANKILNAKQRAVVSIAAFTTKGNMPQLTKALNTGLDAGLTIREIKEILVQLYAYTGFPRSLNALNNFMNVMRERKQKGLEDELGREPNPLPDNQTKLQLGTELQTKLVGQAVKGAVYEFAPAIDQFLKEHLFGDIFGRDNLDWKTRELATIAALASLGGAENQLRSHIGVGMYNGLSEGELNHLVRIIQSSIGKKEGNAAMKELKAALLSGKMNKQLEKHVVLSSNVKEPETIFPKGQKITNNNFTGTAWLEQLVLSDSLNFNQIGNVTFEPGARSNWHLHPGGQILMVMGGVGYYQEKGSSKKLLRKGDVIKCPPNTPHWHGASKDQMFIQVAITPMQNGPVVWMQPVTDEEYNKDL